MFQEDEGRRRPRLATEEELRAAVTRARSEILSEYGVDFFRSYMERTRFIGEDGGFLIFVAETATARDRLKDRGAQDRLEALLSKQVAGLAGVEILLERDLSADQRALMLVPTPVSSPSALGADPSVTPQHPHSYSFDDFCVDDSNFRAYTVSSMIANGAGMPFPLTIIYGPSGSGKSHLLNSIKHVIDHDGSGRTSLLIWAQEFLEGFQAVLNKQRDGAEFKEAMRRPNVLLIDEIQRVFSKRATEQEILTTIALKLQRGGQVVITADTSADGFSGLDERLREILKGATACEMKAPNAALRRRILEKRVAHYARHSPGFAVVPEALDMIANRLCVGGRELDGIVGQLLLEAKVRGELNVTMEIAESALEGKLAQNSFAQKRVTMQQIMKTVSSAYNLSQEELLAKTRRQSVARPRQIVMYLSVVMAGRSLPYIAEKLGGLDHTTVMWGRNKFRKAYDENAEVKAEIDALMERVRAEMPK